MSRWILFLITVALGCGAGLYYGWRINPVEYVDTSPASLRADYKADTVLMVAEAYQGDGDLDMALKRLYMLGEQSPLEIVTEAITFAATIAPPYAEGDLALMHKLANYLKTRFPAVEAGTDE
jgi:hypothetical protein